MRWTYVVALAFLALLAGCGDDGPTGNNNQNQNHGPQCGDGVIDPGEQCDDGAANSDTAPDACRTTCRLPTCGDGTVDSGEGCDDGNADNEDHCLTACYGQEDCCVPNVCGDGWVDRTPEGSNRQTEACDDGTQNGIQCLQDCGQDLATCGNNSLDQGEGCDVGAANSDEPDATCRTDCQPQRCGDGIVDIGAGEACDASVLSDTTPNACRTDCTLPRCGDGVVDDAYGEGCDLGAANSDAPDAACRTDCQPQRCGDGTVDTGEACDDGAGNSDTARDACRTDCTLPYCGDGTVDSGELCDLGTANSDAPDATCRTDCQPQRCGDGIVDAGEACDDGAGNSDTAPDACRTDCTLPRCGDGVADSGELCDGQDVPGVSCGGLGHSGGALGCTADCQAVDDSSCFDCGDGVCELDLGETRTACPTDCGALSVAAGREASCAVTRDQAVWCWGSNRDGQVSPAVTLSECLGSSAGCTPTPVRVLPPGTAQTVVGSKTATFDGGYFCALRTDGRVTCWGDNDRGQLDGQANGPEPGPVIVPDITGAVQVAVGSDVSCAVLGGGTVRCWGNISTGSTSADVAVGGTPLSGVLEVAAGERFACARTDSGSVHCWGSNSYGQLGNGTTTDHTEPVDVLGLSNATSIAAGVNHACAVANAGAVYCWGRNDRGQLGDGSQASRSAPVQVTGLSGALDVDAGSDFSCAVWGAGGARCWGSNDRGRLGIGSMEDSFTPVDVVGISTGLRVSAGGHHACALLSDASLQCWGSNFYGEAGTGHLFHSEVPVEVQGISGGAAGLAAGKRTVCAVDSAGQPLCWGRYVRQTPGSSSNERESSIALPISGAEPASAVSPGDGFGCALRNDGSVVCWGFDDWGQLGRGSGVTYGTYYPTPEPVVGLSGVTALSVGSKTACAVAAGGEVRCWGQGSDGQLGDGVSDHGECSGTTVDCSSTPVTVSGLSGVTHLSVGLRHVCAVAAGGQVYCWGKNDFGQLGDGTTTDSNVPVAVPGLAGVVQVVTGDYHTCALDSAGRVYCWGSNRLGQLGDGIYPHGTSCGGNDCSLAPVRVNTLQPVQLLAASAESTCGVTGLGALLCWGNNNASSLFRSELPDFSGLPISVDLSDLLAPAASVALGMDVACVALSDGTLWCWGNGNYGQLGNAAYWHQLVPARAVGF